jgi:threonine/homoserine/homoserine lactone efflux protein
VSHWAEWATLAALGAYHGLNPGMGWLFAVSQGLQHGDRRAVTRSFVPIAVGHEASVVVVAALVLGLGVVADPGVLHVAAAATLVAFGVFRFVRPRWHPRWTTMRVNRRELTL